MENNGMNGGGNAAGGNFQMPGQGAPMNAGVAGQQQGVPMSAAAQQAIEKPPTKDKEVSSTTQTNLLLSEIRDGLVIMKDGSFRAVVATRPVNFDLMSPQEREGIEYSYQNFLNSLNFTTQILVRSQRVDIGPYLDRLTRLRQAQDNMLLNVLMDDYIDFIDDLSQGYNIMAKQFFVIMPWRTAEAETALTKQGKSALKGMFSSFSKTSVTKIDRAMWDKATTEMGNRVEVVLSGLGAIGMQATRLGTRELGELFYNFNNPDTSVRQPLGDFTKFVNSAYITKGEGTAAQPHLTGGEM